MFYDSLLESVPERRPRRCLATLISFVLQSAGLGALLLIPLWYTGVLPPMPTPIATFFAPSANSDDDFVEITTTADGSPDTGSIVYPSENTPQIRRPGGPRGPRGPVGPEFGPEGAPNLFACVGCPTGSDMNPVLRELFRRQPTPAAPVQAALQKPLRISHMDEGMLLVRVEPQYPRNAILTRTQGEVVLAATISREGRIEQLRLLRGSPFLAEAAMNAVRQWRYRPYILNDQAVAVETLITVNFHLAQ
jgi:protein TonB